MGSKVVFIATEIELIELLEVRLIYTNDVKSFCKAALVIMQGYRDTNP